MRSKPVSLSKVREWLALQERKGGPALQVLQDWAGSFQPPQQVDIPWFDWSAELVKSMRSSFSPSGLRVALRVDPAKGTVEVVDSFSAMDEGMYAEALRKGGYFPSSSDRSPDLSPGSRLMFEERMRLLYDGEKRSRPTYTSRREQEEEELEKLRRDPPTSSASWKPHHHLLPTNPKNPSKR